ncbi:hypothetical protein P175DRAFT_0528067 [Aspergillus ochraceoroseus IBT 24754]|uniref:Malate dehydrogenase n=1 Tax=Aspergillus ochraceoroseus IBT 24754 TaxID=1392256 RepID=A0A2T5M7R0_9EURO|nr:uncharacterized protein P175DRAFT_0528067 [Aspergillus ochraceoroseus IBT 24754]PTU24572.1 hypothetical protein P175DRAFT_0528067 [Aspergillus ochraceoroseus IBT 24754]
MMNWLILLPLFVLSTNASFSNWGLSSVLPSILKHLPVANCNISALSLPSCSLPAPTAGLHLQYVTLGRGTQNYTCSSSSSSATPVAVGATAILFDASCVASLDTTILHNLPDLLKRVPLSGAEITTQLLDWLTGQTMKLGKHFFTAEGAPFFDLRHAGANDDFARAAKVAQVDAPAQFALGETRDVAWLQLKGVEGGIKEVYRVQTAGGGPPATCEGMPSSFTVDYAAEYWFYA